MIYSLISSFKYEAPPKFPELYLPTYIIQPMVTFLEKYTLILRSNSILDKTIVKE